MPAKSESQRKAAGAALAAKRGERPTSSLMGPAKQVAKMTERQLRDYAKKPGNPHPKPRTTRQAAGLTSSQGAKRAKRNSPRARSTKPRTTTQLTPQHSGKRAPRKAPGLAKGKRGRRK